MVELLLLMTLTPAQPDSVGPDTLRDPTKPVPRVRESTSNPILHWNTLALEAIRQARTPPPLAARNLAILHAALFDTLNTLSPRYRSYRVALRALEPIDADAALASCAARVLSELYPRQARTFDRELQTALAGIPVSRPRTLGIGLGRYVADRLLQGRCDEEYDRVESSRPSREEGVWRPTPPGYAPALLPNYGRVKPFGLEDPSTIKLTPPPQLSSKEFQKDLQEVRSLGALDSVTRSAEQAIIAWFWNDGPGTCTPPGHWNQIAQIVVVQKQTSRIDTARIFALLNLALADAAILCWDGKYRYRLWRPVTALRQNEPDWLPLLDTPAFPAYPSGHSTFSGAAATILGQLFGSDEVEFTVGSEGIPGTERTYQGFWEAAHETGRSRIYGGIHYECDNREGLALGKRIAQEILRRRLLPRHTDTPESPLLEGDAIPRPLPKGPESNTASSLRERP